MRVPRHITGTSIWLILWGLIGVSMPSCSSAQDILSAVSFDSLHQWHSARLDGTLKAFKKSCRQIIAASENPSRKPLYGGELSDWKPVCGLALNLPDNTSDKHIRQFFETHFKAFEVHDPDLPKGLITGYYEPEVTGSLKKSEKLHVPVYSRPADLIAFDSAQSKIAGVKYGRLQNSRPVPYYTRRQIEEGAISNQGLELLYLSSYADAFFMAVQGSGRVRLEDGSAIRLAYAGKTGRKYTAIGAVLVADGQIERKDLSMQTIRKWMQEHPDKARQLMWNNKSFVFFRKLENSRSSSGPVGAQYVPLTARTSLAVDRRYWAFGTPVWLETSIRTTKQAERFDNLMIAQDTGSAIRGYNRGDIFFGSGKEAAILAGHMSSPARMVVFLPDTLAERIAR